MALETTIRQIRDGGVLAVAVVSRDGTVLGSDLPTGVFVHFHDIFLPGDYPQAWAWRRYDEQDSVAALIAGGGYALEFSSAWIIACRPECLATGVLARLPLVPGAFESSLWLRKIRL